MSKKEKAEFNILKDTQKNTFLQSLEDFSENDIPSPPVKEKKKKKRLIFYYLSFFLSFTIFCIAGYKVVMIELSSRETSNQYSDLKGVFYKDNSNCLAPDTANYPTLTLFEALGANGVSEEMDKDKIDYLSSLRAGLKALKEQNSDTFGWIKIDGTLIDYPVVYSKIHDYYLRKGFDKNYLVAGCIFVDDRNSQKISENRNTIIYGHNMNDGSMFRTLHNFENEDVFNKEKIVITTFEGVFTYEAFSAHVVDMYYNYIQTDFADDRDFMNFVEDVKSLSKFKKDISIKPTDKILTLSTCTSGDKSERFAVHAVLTDVQYFK